MEGKFSEELRRVLGEREAQCSEEDIPVIITYEPGLDLSKLEKMGFRISRKFEMLNVVSGLIAPSDAKRIANLSQLEKIEYDSEMRVF